METAGSPFSKRVSPNFWPEWRSPITEITPSRHGPLSIATGCFATGLAFGAAFLAAGFAGAAAAGDAVVAEGVCAVAGARKDSRTSTEAANRNMDSRGLAAGGHQT